MKLRVQCSFIIEVEVPDDPEYDAAFDIEENHCLGTGRVGAAIDAHMARCEADGTCWACSLDGKNKILGRKGEHNG